MLRQDLLSCPEAGGSISFSNTLEPTSKTKVAAVLSRARIVLHAEPLDPFSPLLAAALFASGFFALHFCMLACKLNRLLD